MNYISVRTKTKLFKSANPITISIPAEGYDYKAIQQGFIANFIHSFDAANLHILIKMLKESNYENTPLYTIHDCFATTPNNMAKLNKVILSAFIELYFDSNYLEKLNKNLIEQICSYGYETKLLQGKNYLVSLQEDSSNFNKLKDPQECVESDELLLLPSIPSELLEKWTENKEVFVNNIKKSTYFIS